MDTTYIIFLLTFLLFPIIAVVTYQYIQFERISKFIKVVIAFFLLYNFLFLFGFSFKGDYADYLIFSIEFLILCLVLCLKPKNAFNKSFIIIGRIAIIFGFVAGLVGIAKIIIVISLNHYL